MTIFAITATSEQKPRLSFLSFLCLIRVTMASCCGPWPTDVTLALCNVTSRPTFHLVKSPHCIETASTNKKRPILVQPLSSQCPFQHGMGMRMEREWADPPMNLAPILWGLKNQVVTDQPIIILYLKVIFPSKKIKGYMASLVQ